MELLQLTYFCHAAECENFSRTAEHYNVPTSNISRAIRALERELGVKLFTRTANKILLNDSGKKFFKRASNALTQLKLGKNELLLGENDTRGEISLLISTCRRIVTEAIGICRKKYPDIRFSVKHGVLDGDYDLVISDIPPKRGRYERIHLLTERLMLAVSPSSAISDSRLIEERLKEESFISLGEGTRLHSATEDFCHSLGFNPKIEIQTDDPYYVRKYLEMGLGVSLFPEKSWASLYSPEVRLLDIGCPARENYVFVNSKEPVPPAVKAFLDILISVFKKA